MTFPLIPAALAFAEFMPSLVNLLKGEQASESATKVLTAVKEITGLEDTTQSLETLREDAQLVVALQRAILKIEAAMIEDRRNARERDARLGSHNVRADVMVLGATAGLALCLYVLMGGGLAGEAVGMISAIAGIFGACLKDAYAFEFGSSRGSKEKDLAMVNMLEKKLF